MLYGIMPSNKSGRFGRGRDVVAGGLAGHLSAGSVQLHCVSFDFFLLVLFFSFLFLIISNNFSHIYLFQFSSSPHCVGVSKRLCGAFLPAGLNRCIYDCYTLLKAICTCTVI